MYVIYKYIDTHLCYLPFIRNVLHSILSAQNFTAIHRKNPHPIYIKTVFLPHTTHIE